MTVPKKNNLICEINDRINRYLNVVRSDKGSWIETTNQYVFKALQATVKEKSCAPISYMPSKGIKKLREVIADFESRRRGYQIQSNNICVTNGALHGIDLILRTFFPLNQ